MRGRNQTSEKRLDSSSVRKHLAGADVPGFICLLKGKVLEPVGHKFNFSISRNCQELLEIWRKGGKKKGQGKCPVLANFQEIATPPLPPESKKTIFGNQEIELIADRLLPGGGQTSGQFPTTQIRSIVWSEAKFWAILHT